MSPRKPTTRKRAARSKRSAAKPARGRSANNHKWPPVGFSTPRTAPRFAAFTELTILYEGASRPLVPHTPDISSHGMFINTSEHFPEGAVLRLSFRLPYSRRLIEARCEVRHCLSGIGIGVEYLDLDDSSRCAIEDELIHLKTHTRN